MAHLRLVAAAALTLAVGCTNQDNNRPPEAASAASQSRFAEEYPEALDKQSKGFDDDLGGVEKTSASMPGYADELSDPTDYDRAMDVIEAADQAGRSEPYVEAARQRDAIVAFFEDDDGAVNKKIAGAINYAAEQQGCKNMGGAAGAFKRTMEKELEQKMRDANEAHVLIDRYEEELGKANAEKLRKQADDIAEASYTAYIELPTRKYQLERMIAEGTDARATLNREIDDERKTIDDPKASADAKKRAESRIASLEDRKRTLDERLDVAREREKKLEQDVKMAQESYRRALDDLLDAIDKKARAKGGAAREA
jgi:hypothetical protein